MHYDLIFCSFRVKKPGPFNPSSLPHAYLPPSSAAFLSPFPLCFGLKGINGFGALETERGPPSGEISSQMVGSRADENAYRCSTWTLQR